MTITFTFFLISHFVGLQMSFPRSMKNTLIVEERLEMLAHHWCVHPDWVHSWDEFDCSMILDGYSPEEVMELRRLYF